MEKEKFKVTCMERKYKVAGARVSYIITAKKELDEDVTGKLLHEDMELKTFLANYEITNIALPVVDRMEIRNEKVEKMSITTKSRARRELFDFLNLPEEFTTKDYEKALEEKGVKVTNSAMSNDDLRRLGEKGKVVMIEKRKIGRHITGIYKRLRKDEDKSITEFDKTISSLKEGQRVVLGTIKD